MDSYTKRKVVGVGIEVRSHGNAERGRGAGCKSWLLINVIFTLATDPPTPAPTLTYIIVVYTHKAVTRVLLYSIYICSSYLLLLYRVCVVYVH